MLRNEFRAYITSPCTPLQMALNARLLPFLQTYLHTHIERARYCEISVVHAVPNFCYCLTSLFTSGIQLHFSHFSILNFSPHPPSLTMPGNVQTIHVPHLGGIDAAYQMSQPYDPSKPTLVLINSFCTSSDLYTSQFKDQALTTSANLIAIELLGHGQTRTKSEHFTYWDTAIMNIQVLEKLGIERWFVLGTSQGGWVTVRMALLAPQKVCCFVPCFRVYVECIVLTLPPAIVPRHHPTRNINGPRIPSRTLPRLLGRHSSLYTFHPILDEH